MRPRTHRTRRRFCLLLVIPALFYLCLELLLLLFNGGSPYPLVTKQVLYGNEKYVINREVPRRYFSLPPDKTPEASGEYFNVEKQPDELRIFCLGGSTTLGFPYEFNATFPFQLESRLRNALPECAVDVVNFGIGAINSYSVRDLMPEILELEPDLIILYMGHNEFYGPYGVGSTHAAGQNRALTNWYIKLKRLRTVQMVEQCIHRAGRFFGGEEDPRYRSMMEAMSSGRTIPLDSEAFRVACRDFEANLSDIVRLAQEKNIPVVVGNLVSNLQDHAPFASTLSNLTDDDVQMYRATLSEGKRLLANREYRAGLMQLESLEKYSPADAETRFLLGKAHLALGDTTAALENLQSARDLDELRFRAPTRFNGIIEVVARKLDVPLVDLERVFRHAAPSGIPGNDLFLEHLHPNFDGYRLMAQAFFEALLTLRFTDSAVPIGYHEDLLSEDRLDRIVDVYSQENGGVTPLDEEIGALKNYILLHQWPFEAVDLDLDQYKPHHSEATRDFATFYLSKKPHWDSLHYGLAEWYAAEKRFKEAVSELRAIHLTFSDDYVPPLMIGDLFMRQSLYEQAARNYQYAADRNTSSVLIRRKLDVALRNVQTL